MLITCDNKGCLKSSNALLNEATGEVICDECGLPIENVAPTMKRALKSFGQIVRSERKAFMLACKSCNANREVVLDQNNNTLCKTCHSPLAVHAAFKLAMQESGGLDRITIEETETPKTAKKKTTRKKVTRKKATTDE